MKLFLLGLAGGFLLLFIFINSVVGSRVEQTKVFIINAAHIRMDMERDPKMEMEIMRNLVSIYFNRLNEMRLGVSNLLKVFKSKTS